MKFCEAMDKLKEGAKVTRESWSGSIYFKFDGKEVKSYQPSLQIYNYNDDIMISGGWLVEGQEGEYKFCEIIPFLQQGFKAKLKDWVEMYIFLDKSSGSLTLHCMAEMHFIPDFAAFTATDWIEIL